ncbi:class I SAM-dependent methyltransferase [Occultella gossypii]|uniref:Class I SAM-dependent methyltransferase n=1 Tax=Occultella gossypii TaxID=2800820 RepID=A0ABS7SE31_9MICO|nr:class I SAM-dependent methyltransferase [Occultella gossypii]MBZ2198312.1 class I SAM-dependent methyltransferase [Occultella gossypii]
MNPFDAAGADFLRLAPLLWDPTSAALVEVAAPEPGDRVLDACCGVGSSALPAAVAIGPDGRLDAVDTSVALVDILRHRPERPPWLHPHLHDVTTWRRPSGGYDVVQCALGIFFFPVMADGVAHLISLARPGGRVVLSVWRRGSLVEVGEALLTAYRRTTGTDVDRPHSPIAAIDEVDALRAWSVDRGLSDVIVTEHSLHLDVDAEQAWLIVVGSGWRGLVESLPAAGRQRLRAAFADELGRRGVQTVQASTMVVSGTVPPRRAGPSLG